MRVYASIGKAQEDLYFVESKKSKRFFMIRFFPDGTQIHQWVRMIFPKSLRQQSKRRGTVEEISDSLFYLIFDAIGRKGESAVSKTIIKRLREKKNKFQETS